jgi:aminoglycoside phosphotransferase (APT) family kinase protein
LAGSIEELLTRCVAAWYPGACSVIGPTRLSGGASQETWSFDIVHPNGNVGAILRRAPPGYGAAPTRAAGLNAEARLMQLAHAAGVPSPEVLYVLRPQDELGTGFVMRRVEGETIPRKILRDGQFADARVKLARQCGEILARIHALPQAELPKLRRMTPQTEIAQLDQEYRSFDRPRPVFELALRWLRDHDPGPCAEATLVHGDFRHGNLIIGADGIRAVLDWELAHTGDPMEDLGWICVNSWRFGEIDKPVGGFGTREDLFAGYEAAGRRVEPGRVHFWEVMGTLRWGIMCCGMMQRFRLGPDHSLERAMIGRRSSETEIDLLRLLAPRGGADAG